ncbi:hypothetical protein [Micromonospora lutea]|uniref:LPXTG-motif cell wall-anchored protein n=1 Tax=Micromonospora lutea TaxID=419825 RepID=A0ABQ4J056_9ACTN|nr:hypothetical protein [Micromonospora lutea]GIJ23373.1 hypothetical protein Vlu01_39970 [Micromonospora lutea]
MIFRTRRAASLATAALLASGTFTALGAPAYAAGTETDLALTAAGTRATDGVEAKVGWAKIANQGEGTPTKVLVKVDTSKVDDSKLIVASVTEGGCEVTGDTKPELWVCELDKEEIPGPGETTEVPIVLFKAAEGVTGPYQAPVTISIESSDDTDESNNSVEINVELTPESGVDLGVIVPDVKTRIDLETLDEDGPVHPGDRTVFWSEIANQGDLTAQGLKLTYQLPKGVSFLPVEGCEISSDKRRAVCEDDTFLLERDTVLVVPLAVEVGKGVEAPVTLTGGSLEAVAFGALSPDARISQQATKPGFGKAEVREIKESEFADIDPTDNSDDFAVVVAATSGGGGGGGGLPVTGVQAGLIGGIGAGVVLAGVAMFLVARRRRVVLVTPGDEKTNA